MTRTSLQPILAVSLLAVACAHVQTTAPAVSQQQQEKPPEDRTIRFSPIIVKVTPEDVALSELNDEELYAIGQNAMAAGDNQKAARHFERLADNFPNSKHHAEALHLSGLMLEKMKDYSNALTRFADAAKAYGNTPEGAESTFKVADEYFFLGDYDAAAAALEPLSYATYLPGTKQMEAKVKRGIVLFSAGRSDEAEKIFRTAVDEMKGSMQDDYRDGYLPSQAQFYLAEIFRERFQAVKLDPATVTKEQLMQDLEYKAQMLLSAQGHYLRCIRVGHPEWATASGYRIGELYQNFYEQLINSTPPKELEPDAVPFYKEELHARLKNVIMKAIDAYEKTLATAERVGATNPFVAQTREQLDKMKALMLTEPPQDSKPTTTETTKPAETKKPDQS